MTATYYLKLNISKNYIFFENIDIIIFETLKIH